MKKLLLLSLVGVCLFFSCDNGSMEETSNPFIGTWESYSGAHWVFTATNATVYRSTGDMYWTGTYTYNDTHIIAELDTELSHPEMVEAYGDTFSPPYEFGDFGDNYTLRINMNLLKKAS